MKSSTKAPKRKELVEEKLSHSPPTNKAKRVKTVEEPPKRTSEFLFGQLSKARTFLVDLSERKELTDQTKLDIKEFVDLIF